ncbi:Peptidoglycan-binding Lysin subgroup [Corchorus capsularis]|uniref:Peptidoglycan-binding Lysin subgroup n=1 Tax=Corchorus capsularis TaxID=210143 RepID=A0A1R3KGT9_COCAP|nr:Peptidoglycan-binding Lysin subgroup [Corchorus capsularis]
MGFASGKPFLLLALFIALTLNYSTAQIFNCSSPRSCHALVGYRVVNNTDLDGIQSLFNNVKNLRNLLGANNLNSSTPRTFNVSAKQVIKIPVNCVCFNGTGTSGGVPVYKVQPDDGLYHIAAEVFSGLVLYPQIQQANGIVDANKIEIGQELKIPLPCSCDEVNGEKVVHYAHVVESGSTLAVIARQFGTDEETLSRLNGGVTDSTLKADQAIDVPLKACNSSIRSDSPDFPLLVANGTYVFTANNCVKCTCDAANNWTLQCEPSGNKPSNWESCPTMQCENNLTLGNSTGSGCSRSICSYAGYSNSTTTIFTTLAQDPSCSTSTPSNGVPRISLNWGLLFILFLLCFHLFQ